MNIVTQNGINLATELIKQFEGCSLIPYYCPANIPTIGYGSTCYEDGTKVTMIDKPLTQKQADDLLQWHLTTQCITYAEMILTLLTDNQNGAILSLIYNIGGNAFKNSTLFNLLNNGAITTVLTKESWLCWNKARIDGMLQPVKGLTRRRQLEWDLFNLTI